LVSGSVLEVSSGRTAHEAGMIYKASNGKCKEAERKQIHWWYDEQLLA
jgi:uncharacterized protein YggL (DUF469 family)